MSHSPSLPWRAFGVALAGAVSCSLVAVVFVRIGVSSWALASRPGTGRPEDALLALIALLGALLTAWLAMATVLAALAEVPGAVGSACARLSSRVTPAVVRRLVTIAVGSALVAATAPATASAVTAATAARHTVVATLDQPPDPTFRPLAEPTPGPAVAVSTPDPGFVPLAPSAPVATATSIDTLERAPRQLPEAGEMHVVRRGDTLWDIAAARLGPGATAGDIAAAWPRWYAANRRLIGPDPSHIVPGQRLVPPPEGTLAGSPAAVLTSPGASR